MPLFEAPLDHLAGSEFAEAFNQRLLSIELERPLTALGELGLADLAIHLRRLGIKRIALIAYGLLALFPIPAVVIPGETQDAPPTRLGNLFEVTLAPSARSYTIARARAVQADRERTARASRNAPGGVRDLILAVGNPLPLPYGMRSPIIYHGNLAFAAAEADGVRRIGEVLGYARREIVTYVGKMATRTHLLDSLTRSWYAHLAMHGQFDPLRPRNSRLILAGDTSVPEPDRILTLGECLDGVVNLKGLRLLVLSACETSLIDVRNSVNEVIGIAAGFLQAGAAAVIASLWPVDDRATFLLMTRFMQLWLDPNRGWPPARCLAEAQRWMREEATNAVIAAYDPNLRLPRNDTSGADSREPVEAFALAGTRSLRYLRYTQITALDQLRIAALNSGDPDHHPYANPIYWAAFTVTGA